MSRVGRGLISSDDSTGAVTLPSAPAILPMSQGGFGVDVSAKTGAVHQYVGTFGWESGTVLVDAIGADPTGVADSSVAVQAAIDANYRKVVFNPSGTYLFNTAVTVPNITDGNTLNIGREIDGQGCLIVAGNGIDACFKPVCAAAPNMYMYNKMHDFRFSGTVTQAFIYFATSRAWYNEFYNLTAIESAHGPSLLELHNDSAISQPGMFRIENLKSSLEATVRFSREATALIQFDNFYVSRIMGGGYDQTTGLCIPDSAAILLEDGVNFTTGEINNVISGGTHGIYASNGYIQASKISRIYVEVPLKSSYPGSDTATNYTLAANCSWCEIDTLSMNINSHTDNPGAKLFYGIAANCNIRNLKFFCGDGFTTTEHTDWPGYPFDYSLTYYILAILGGSYNVTYDFPGGHHYLDRGAYIQGENITYIHGGAHYIANITQTLADYQCRNTTIGNFGMAAGVPATVTLPPAKQGMSVKFTIQNAAAAYHIKAGAGDKIVLNGTALDDGDKVSNASPANGHSIHFSTFLSEYTSGYEYDYDWIAVTEGGTWIDGGA